MQKHESPTEKCLPTGGPVGRLLYDVQNVSRATCPRHSCYEHVGHRLGDVHVPGFLRYLPPGRYPRDRTPAHQSPQMSHYLPGWWGCGVSDIKLLGLENQLELETGRSTRWQDPGSLGARPPQGQSLQTPGCQPLSTGKQVTADRTPTGVLTWPAAPASHLSPPPPPCWLPGGLCSLPALRPAGRCRAEATLPSR